MLYRSTRNKIDSFTAYRALRQDRGADYGYILPLRVPYFDSVKIEAMKTAEFSENVADLLNLFFGSSFTAWDVESTIGKSPLQLVECSQKIILAQCWKNTASIMAYYQQNIYERLCPDKGVKPTAWAKLAIRIGLVAATVLHLPETEVDVAVNAGDFEQAVAVYYCRMMGIPIRKILIACNENSNIWDFAYRGVIHCGATLQKTNYPEQDRVIPDLFEAYLFLAYGYEETQRFLKAASAKQDYQLPEESDAPAIDNLFASVVGQDRIPAVISSFHSKNGLSVNPYTAFSLGALQDYRAKAGESNPTLVFEEAAP